VKISVGYSLIDGDVVGSGSGSGVGTSAPFSWQ